MVNDGMFDKDGNLKDGIKEQGLDLVRQIALLCQGKDPTVVLMVMEAIMTEQITMVSQPLGDLFAAMMKDFKKKATLLLHVMEVLEEAGDKYVNDGKLPDFNLDEQKDKPN